MKARIRRHRTTIAWVVLAVGYIFAYVAMGYAASLSRTGVL